MSKPEELISKIPFFKKRPALTAVIVILLAVLTFSILNLDKMLNFKIWMGGKDVAIIVTDSAVTPSELFTTGFTHMVTFQVMNSRSTPLILERVFVVDWKTREYIRGYQYLPTDNAPVKSGEIRYFKTANYLVDSPPNLGPNDEITQGLQIVTNFKTYWIPITSYQISFVKEKITSK